MFSNCIPNFCGKRVERNSPGYQLGDGGAAPPFRSFIDDENKDESAPYKEEASSNFFMGEQVANNREMQMVMYLHFDKGKWYILSEPKSPGLVKKEYVPIGNRLVYPKKWGRKKAAEVLLNHLIEENKKICEVANERLEYLNELSKDVNKWD